jgi:hypothetical protein
MMTPLHRPTRGDPDIPRGPTAVPDTTPVPTLPLRAVLLALILCTTCADLASAAGRRFVTGYAGTVPTATADRARTYFDEPAVRILIARLEDGPVTVSDAEQALAAGPVRLSDLVRLKLVRADRGKIRLGFAYFTAADMRRVQAVAARHVPSLVAAYAARRQDFARIFSRYGARSVDRGRLAFVMISGVGLNWDALDLLAETGRRRPVLASGPGWQYSFFASEVLPDQDYRGFYWGSSALPGDRQLADPLPLAFASFGDPPSEPRMNLPDLLGLRADRMTPELRAAAADLGFTDDPLVGRGVLGLAAGRRLARLLIAVREGATHEADLVARLPGDPVAAELQLLEAADYVRRSGDGEVALAAPVFTEADAEVFAAARRLNREILRGWLRRNYPAMRAELADLTAARQGVAYEALFTQIWHEVFGLATRDLAAAGVTGDPYAADNPSPGSLGMAWRPSLLERAWR